MGDNNTTESAAAPQENTRSNSVCSASESLSSIAANALAMLPSPSTPNPKKRALSYDDDTTQESKKRRITYFDDAGPYATMECGTTRDWKDLSSAERAAFLKRKADDEPIVDDHNRGAKRCRLDTADADGEVPTERPVETEEQAVGEDATLGKEQAAGDDATLEKEQVVGKDAILKKEQADDSAAVKWVAAEKQGEELEEGGLADAGPSKKRKAEESLEDEPPAKKAKLEASAEETVAQAEGESTATRATTLDNNAEAKGVEVNKEPDTTGAPKKNGAHFRFLDLPIEIRDLIYGEIVNPDHDKVSSPSLLPRWPCKEREKCTQPKAVKIANPAIFCVSHQVCEDASAVLYGHRKFEVVAGPALCRCERHESDRTAVPPAGDRALVELRRLSAWLKTIGPRNRTYIEHLTLETSLAAWDDDMRRNFRLLLETIASLLGRAHTLADLTLRLDLDKEDDIYNANLPAHVALGALAPRVQSVPNMNINSTRIREATEEKWLPHRRSSETGPPPEPPSW